MKEIKTIGELKALGLLKGIYNPLCRYFTTAGYVINTRHISRFDAMSVDVLNGMSKSEFAKEVYMSGTKSGKKIDKLEYILGLMGFKMSE